MATISRRIRRLMGGKSQTVPTFSAEELAIVSKLPAPTLASLQARIAEVQPDHLMAAAPAPAPVVEAAPAPEAKPEAKTLPVYDGFSRGTTLTPKAKKYGGVVWGPFKNQPEGRKAVREALGLSQCPAGTWARH